MAGGGVWAQLAAKQAAKMAKTMSRQHSRQDKWTTMRGKSWQQCANAGRPAGSHSDRPEKPV